MPGAVLGARGTRDDPALVELTSAWEWGCLGAENKGEKPESGKEWCVCYSRKFRLRNEDKGDVW